MRIHMTRHDLSRGEFRSSWRINPLRVAIVWSQGSVGERGDLIRA